MPIEAVIFDWGGTLSEFAEIELYDMWKLAAAYLASTTGRSESELTEKLLAAELRYWEGVKTTQSAGTLAQILAAESRALGLDVTEAVVEAAAQLHLDAWTPHIRHHADAVPTLRALRAAGLKLGLLSNTHWPATFHEHFLERDGLLELLDVRAYTSNLPRSKPHASAFQHVLAELGVAPEHALMVGDRPIDDIRGAQSVGMRGIWRPHASAPALGDVVPDGVIASLWELVGLVNAESANQ
jgi:putative hydrolase of the HAD superfamily